MVMFPVSVHVFGVSRAAAAGPAPAAAGLLHKIPIAEADAEGVFASGRHRLDNYCKL